MNCLMLISVVFAISLQQVAQKAYNVKIKGGAYTFSTISSLCAVIFFVLISGGNLSFSADVFTYSVFFAVAYAVSIVGLFLSIKTGPLSLTSLLTSYSLIIPALYGIIFLGEPVDFMLVLGLVLLFISLALINCENKGEQRRITAKWVFYVFLAFAGNGMCTVIQKMQQQSFSGEYKSEFMVMALSMVVAVLFVFAFLFEKKEIVRSVKSGAVWCSLCGLCNGLVNFLVMVLANRMAVSLMFPLISAGGIVLTFSVSRFVYKEKLSAQQNIGVVLGILAVIALNL